MNHFWSRILIPTFAGLPIGCCVRADEPLTFSELKQKVKAEREKLQSGRFQFRVKRTYETHSFESDEVVSTRSESWEGSCDFDLVSKSYLMDYTKSNSATTTPRKTSLFAIASCTGKRSNGNRLRDNLFRLISPADGPIPIPDHHRTFLRHVRSTFT